MKYLDAVYGEQIIEEPWVLAVIKHPEFLRLKGINQYGFVKPYYPEAKTNRLEHSIGVFLLLRKFGLGEKEQLAGLLHDVSHTVFSHCIDYAVDKDDPELQNYQDEGHEKYLRSSALIPVIEQYGFKIDDVATYKNYRALETELPDLCADRIDYILRDAIAFGVIDGQKASRILKDLACEDGKWFFRDVLCARDMSYLFKKMNNDFYSTTWTASMFLTVGSYVSYALKKGYIKYKDLYSTDDGVIGKINENLRDEALRDKWETMIDPEFQVDRENYDHIIKTKSRIIDPLVSWQGELKRFSALDQTWREVVKSEMSAKEHFLKIGKRSI